MTNDAMGRIGELRSLQCDAENLAEELMGLESLPRAALTERLTEALTSVDELRELIRALIARNTPA